MTLNYVKFLDFVRFCNENSINESDYSIAKSLILHVSDINEMTISDIAEEANSSVASVSRFIRKMGFQSLNEFRTKMPRDKNNYQNLMNMLFIKSNGFLNDGQIEHNLINEALDNLKSTISILDDSKINQLIDMIFESSSISLLGDTREVRTFYTFQLGLMMLNKPVFAFTNSEIAIHHLSMMKEGDTVIYFVLAKEWFTDSMKKKLCNAYQKGAKIVIFTQDELEDDVKAELIISYGKPGSHNNGYYSLTFLCNLIYSLIMNRNPEFHSSN